MSATMNWRRAKAPKPTQHANTRFPNDRLGRTAKAAFLKWKGGLSRSQKRTLYSAPTR